MTTESQVSQQNETSQLLDFALVAKTTFVHSVRNTVQSLCSKKDQDVVVTITTTGIKFTVEESTTTQGNAFLPDTAFQEYHFHRTKEQFKIKLNLFIESLSLFGTKVDKEDNVAGPSLQMLYHPDRPFQLILESSGVLVQASIKTLDNDNPPIQFNLRAAEVPCKLIIKSENFADALNELDWSNKNCKLAISPEFPYFRLTSSGAASSCQIDYPKDSDAFEAFECTKPVEFSYKLKHVFMCVKAVSGSTKTQIRINENGLLQLQNMFQFSEGLHCFIDFFFMPETDDVLN